MQIYRQVLRLEIRCEMYTRKLLGEDLAANTDWKLMVAVEVFKHWLGEEERSATTTGPSNIIGSFVHSTCTRRAS